jgi:integrase
VVTVTPLRSSSNGIVRNRDCLSIELSYCATECSSNAGIRRVKGAKKLGIRLGNWLSASEARALWRSPDAETLTSKPDRAIIAVLLGCGLRRRELADLT